MVATGDTIGDMDEQDSDEDLTEEAKGNTHTDVII